MTKNKQLAWMWMIGIPSLIVGIMTWWSMRHPSVWEAVKVTGYVVGGIIALMALMLAGIAASEATKWAWEELHKKEPPPPRPESSRGVEDGRLLREEPNAGEEGKPDTNAEGNLPA